MNYKNYIRGKNVVFVGASPINQGTEKGQWIDSFDVVIKTNGSVILQSDKDYSKDYGSRIDVLYCNVQFNREMSPFPIRKWRTHGLKWLCFKGGYSEKYSKEIPCRTMKSAILKVSRDLPSATMGAYILQDLIDCEAKSITFTGVDFFSSKKACFEHDNYQEYIDGYLPDKIRTQGNQINVGKTEDGHNFDENANFFHSHCQVGRVSFDNDVNLILDKIVKGELKQK
jgi:hypothetical protein